MTDTEEVTHALTINNDGTAGCSCGFPMPSGNKPAQTVKNWERHLLLDEKMDQLRTLAEVEHTARMTNEKLVRELIELGVGSRQISALTKIDGKPVISPTVVQRIGREAFAEKPRRRRRS